MTVVWNRSGGAVVCWWWLWWVCSVPHVGRYVCVWGVQMARRIGHALGDDDDAANIRQALSLRCMCRQLWNKSIGKFSRDFVVLEVDGEYVG